jgi:Domain of unknown function (DUF4440)
MKVIHCLFRLVSAISILTLPIATLAADDDMEIAPAERALPALTQQLMDAVTAGDKSVWERYLSARVSYISEAGERLDRSALVEDLKPLPAGMSGSIKVQNSQVTDAGDTAIHVFDAFEQESVFGQAIQVSYRATDTWHREEGKWRLLASQTVVLAKDPTPLPIDLSRLGDFAGTYQISPQRRFRVERRGDGLFGGPEGSDLKPMIAVGDNVFVQAQSNLGILRIFVRAPDGSVERMVERRKFADTQWRRAPVVEKK